MKNLDIVINEKKQGLQMQIDEIKKEIEIVSQIKNTGMWIDEIGIDCNNCAYRLPSCKTDRSICKQGNVEYLERERA